MPITSIANNTILNYIDSLNLNMSKLQLNHLKNLVTGIISIDSKRNISNLSSKILGSKDRSSVTKFLNYSPWDVDELNLNRIKNLFSFVKPKANEPMFIAIDNTVISKSADTKHIEGLGYHFSHTEGKTVWRHCIVSSQLITKNHSISLDFKQFFNKNFCLENTSKALIEKSLSYGYHIVSGLKLNRCIYPQGIKIKISDFIKYTTETDFKDVTVNNKKYKAYRYEGKVSGIDNAVVLICYEANKDNPKIMAILSKDIYSFID